MENVSNLLWNDEYIEKQSTEEITLADIQIACITNSCGGMVLYSGCSCPPFGLASCGSTD